jgi:hypothetical protein
MMLESFKSEGDVSVGAGVNIGAGGVVGVAAPIVVGTTVVASIGAGVGCAAVVI